mmetsp:Transcript_3256/g.6473  ORF Transcript_3256/g.6473 Transcript_3256/m.6473 type:complete len:406 (+) Transcript_3256:260-1477(+)
MAAPAAELSDNSMFLQKACTVILVTSPIESHPSTELLDRCLSSIIRSFPELDGCRIIVACDGAKCVADGAVKPWRRIFGKTDKATVQKYRGFLESLTARPWMVCNRPREVFNGNESSLPIPDLETGLEWLGFALTLKRALGLVTTPTVFVTCHDFELLPETLVGVNTRELVDALLANHGNGEESTRTSPCPPNYIGLPTMKAHSFALRHAEALKGLPLLSLENSSLVLEPMGMWKDSPHFARTDTYRDLVFGQAGSEENPRLHVFKRGHFIEDTLGQRMIDALKKAPCAAPLLGAAESTGQSGGATKAAVFARFGTYLLRCQKPCIYHLDGRVYVPVSKRAAKGYELAEFESERAEAARVFVLQRQALISAEEEESPQSSLQTHRNRNRPQEGVGVSASDENCGA